MPETWTDKSVIHISDKLDELVSDEERDILRELAQDCLNYSEQWLQTDERYHCLFLTSDGLATRVTVGVATVGSSFATVYYCDLENKPIASICRPLQRIEEFEVDTVDSEYESLSPKQRDVIQVTRGETRPLRPLEFNADDE